MFSRERAQKKSEAIITVVTKNPFQFGKTSFALKNFKRIFLKYLFNTASSAAPQIPVIQRKIGSNLGGLRNNNPLFHFRSIKKVDLLYCMRCNAQVSEELDHFPCLKAVTVSMLTSRPFWLKKDEEKHT
jgi:hypothetical protein